MPNKFVCEKPCPICGGEVQVFGTECYPDEGFDFECMNGQCLYEGHLSCNVPVTGLHDLAKMAHDKIYEILKGQKNAPIKS